MSSRQRLVAFSFGFLAFAAANAAPPATTPPAKKEPVQGTVAKTAPTPQAGAAITGTVTDPSGKPVAQATVLVVGKDDEARRRVGGFDPPVVVKTSEDGTFLTGGLKGKTFTVYVVAQKHAPALLKDVPAGAALRVKMKAGLALGGSVVDMDRREPVAGATVLAWTSGGALFGEDGALRTKTDDAGRFSFGELPAGAVVLEAFSPRHARARLGDIQVQAPKADGTPSVPAPLMVLRPGGRIAGRIVDAAGKPVARARIDPAPVQLDIRALLRDAPLRPAFTDEAGKFALDGIPSGTSFRLRASTDKGATAESGPVSVEAGAERNDIELKIEPGASLAFRLLDADEHPVSRVEVVLTPTERNRRERMAMDGDAEEDKIRSLGEGRFEVKRLEAGTFDLTLLPEDFAAIEKEGIKLRSGESLDLGTLLVKEERTISGRVTDGTGQPVPRADVTALWTDGGATKSRTVKTKADGSYRLPGLGEQRVFRMGVRAKGFAAEQGAGASPGDTGVDFVLKRSATIVGRVLRADGTAPPSFRVRNYPEAADGRGSRNMRAMTGIGGADDDVFADPSGNFRLEDVAPGTVTVEATSPGKAPARKTGIKVESEQAADVGTLTLGDGRTLRGRVLDAKDDTPVTGAVVGESVPQGMGFRMASGREEIGALSGIDGSFEIAGLESRTYQVAVQHPNFSPSESKIDVPLDEDPPELVVKLSRGGTLTGIVRDAGRQPVVGATVVALRGSSAGGTNSATTGPDGRYTMEKLAPGDYTLMRPPGSGGRVRGTSGGLSMRQVNIKEGEVTVFDFDESAAIALSGRILRGGRPVGNAELILFRTGGAAGTGADGVEMTRSDADGRYHVSLEKPGPYMAGVRADLTGGSQSRSRIVVPDEPSPNVDILLASGGITGRVIGLQGKPLSDVAISAMREGSSPMSGVGVSKRTGADGTFGLEGLEPGSWMLTANAPGYRTGNPPPVTVAEDGSSSPVEIRLETGRAIRGRFLDARGQGIARGIVLVAPSGSIQSDSMPASTDVTGAFVITAPAEGPVDLVALAAGYAPARTAGVLPDPTGSSEVVLQSRPGAIIRVLVVGADGKPVAGAMVDPRPNPPFLGSEMFRLLNRLQTDSTGVATATSLAGGGYDVTATSAGKSAAVTISVADGSQTEARIVLP
jgi:protocatechuate 3,4-dioxygenase beta subunit